MEKNALTTNLLGRRVRFVHPDDHWDGPVDKRYADLVPPEERKVGSFLPGCRGKGFPAGEFGEIVAAWLDSDGEPRLSVRLDSGKTYQTYLDYGREGWFKIERAPAVKDPIAKELGRIRNELALIRGAIGRS